MAIIKRIASEAYVEEKSTQEALEAIENIPQPDWNQNDESAPDFIKNKPFYEAEVLSIMYEGQVDLGTAPAGFGGMLEEWILCEKGKTYNVTLKGENYEFVCQEVVCVQDGRLEFDPDSYYHVIISGDLFDAYLNDEFADNNSDFGEGICNLKVEENVTALKTLDEKFIPDTIARTNQIPGSDDLVTSINGQTGDVTIEIPEVEYPVTSVNGQIGDVTIEIPEVKYPVTSVNGQTGDVTIEIPEVSLQMQSDWNQSDEISVAFIKNKPFYEKEVSNVIYEGQVDLTMGFYYSSLDGTLEEEIAWEKGKTYNVTLKGENYEFVCQEVVCEQDGRLRFDIPDSLFYVEIFGNSFSVYSNDEYFDDTVFEEGTYNLKIEGNVTTLKTLDEKFIPDTIARTSDIPETIPQVQSDWNQNDETLVDYVKNRPFFEKTEVITIRTCSFEHANRANYESKTRGPDTYYKISNDVYPQTADVMLSVDLSGTESVAFPKGNDTTEFRRAILTINSVYSVVGYIVYEDECEIPGPSITLTKGIWFQTYTKLIPNGEFAYANITETRTETTIKTLDEKFIPDTIARIEDVNAPKTEFILNSSTEGSTKKFKLTIDDNGTLTIVESTT